MMMVVSAAPVEGAERQSLVKIMALGDSITRNAQHVYGSYLVGGKRRGSL
jgi:low temperature requirement protein LtrA